VRAGRERVDRAEPAEGRPSSLSPPTISLPRGGGAIRGIDEKLAVTAVTGTASLSLGLPLSSGRPGISPSLSLTYDSGTGQSPFGLGWALSIGSISRKTDPRLPRYRDAEESDVFVLSGADDLVPVLRSDGVRERFERDGHRVDRYRPRIEGLFARIERCTRLADGDVHWRVITPDNVTTFYGLRSGARVADPADPRRVFQWLIEEVRDDRGSVVVYEYKPEDGAGVAPDRPEERNRRARGFAQRYPKRVLYGNGRPFAAGEWLLEAVFDYGEHDPDAPAPGERRAWAVRADPFASHRAGFEVRTYRLCRRVLVFHRFPELGPEPVLVRSLDLAYQESPTATLLRSVTQTGYVREGDAYRRRSLPPLELAYTEASLDPEVRAIEPGSLVDWPWLDGARGQWVDLDGEGLSGVLAEQADGWFYKRNLGGGRFGPARPVVERPSLARLSAGFQQLVDLTGDGRVGLVELQGDDPGVYEADPEGGWRPFRPFASRPVVPWDDPHLRLVDLDGDGRADLLITEDEVFRWHPSLGELGFGPGETTPRSRDEEQGPRLAFADAGESVFLADMDGDGLADIVRIRNGEIAYWPSEGYARFGPKVTMARAPVFDAPERFHGRRIRLADLDGTGPADIVYLGRDGAVLYRNESGNGWEPAHPIPAFPPGGDLAAVSVLDLLGTGTACLVWVSPLPGHAGHHVRYIDLLGGRKPHLLESVRNGLGAETRLTYAPSTRFYLEDARAGRPWVTRLPFPVHVVERQETRDGVTGLTLVTRYRYRHGFYDGDEREFRGFACVEAQDAESFEVARAGGDGVDEEHYQPPVLTRTWYHTGAYVEGGRIARHLAAEYYAGDAHPRASGLGDTALPAGLTAEEQREAVRALKGRVLRQETYALDGTDREPHPYVATESGHELRVLQGRAGNAHAVFAVHPRDVVTHHYERDPDDSRVGHELTLEVDEFGHATKTAAVSYPRRAPAFPEQGRLAVVYTESDLLHRPGEPGWYRLGLPLESRSYELTGLAMPAGLLTGEAIREAARRAEEIPYEAAPTPGRLERRLIGRARHTYYRNDLAGPLPLGAVESLALPHASFAMALTPGLVAEVYGGRVDDAVLRGAGYARFDGDPSWWVPSGRAEFDAERFYVPIAFRDVFDNRLAVSYDPHALLLVETVDGLGNRVRAESDYRVLGPWRVTDPNGSRTAAAYDELGSVTATAVMGREGSDEGDTLEDPTTRLEYDLDRWVRDRKPASVRTLARERHRDPATPWQEHRVYSDGMGRQVQVKARAEPDPETGAGRWVGTGRTLFNNKGDPVKQYEPFFSSTPDYEDEAAMVEQGVTPVLRYDPVGRLVRTDRPDGSVTRVVFDPWREEAWDANDTAAESRWSAERLGRPEGDPERRAAELAVGHAATPGVAHLDGQGRTFLTEADNGVAEDGERRIYRTHLDLDVEGHPRRVTDARGNPVMRYRYDLLGGVLHRVSPDSGERWALADAAGKPLRAWDARGRRIRWEHDALQRPTGCLVGEGEEPETLVERTVYGEGHPEAERFNLRGRVYQVFDGAGVAVNEAYDFKGNLLRGGRRLARDYRGRLDWSGAPVLEAETFESRTAYDALSRPTSLVTPDGSEIRPAYNEAGLLERVEARLRGAEPPVPFVTGVDYDAKGQRLAIRYGNGARTDCEYDPFTFRLRRLLTTRPAGAGPLQDLRYTYDPVGNVTDVRDDAQPTVFFRNAVVEAHGRYAYDPLYRLVLAEGREHGGAGADRAVDHEELPGADIPHDNDAQALRRYAEEYAYDEVGNVLRVIHRAEGGHWTRRYAYASDSNRLLATSLPGDHDDGPYSGRYEYDPHGSMTRMPHLAALDWDVDDRLQSVDLGGGGRAFCVYDAGGQRVRKVREHLGGLVEERIYLGAFEVYRRRAGDTLELERETLHVMDDRRRVALVETRTVDRDAPGLTPTPRVRYQLDDHLGSAVLELDEEARVIGYEAYHPYGTTAYQAARAGVEVSPRRYRYTGMERDEETGLGYHTARYYAPWLGRWTSADPVGLAGGSNVYAYSANRPVGAHDRAGTQHTDIGDDPELRAAAREVHRARPDLEAPRPSAAPRRTVSRERARAEANQGAARVRRQQGMTDPDVRAGHTRAARHAPESGISRAEMNRPETFQHLHSSRQRGRGLRVTIRETGRRTRQLTRHGAQEGLIDESAARVRAQSGGRLTPEGQAAAGDEVLWRTQGTGLDQREVAARRASGLFDEAAAIERSPAVRQARAARPGPPEPPPAPAAPAAEPVVPPARTPPGGGPPGLRMQLSPEVPVGGPTTGGPGLQGMGWGGMAMVFQSQIETLAEFLSAGLRLDIEARARHSDVFVMTPEDRAELRRVQAERAAVQAFMQQYGIDEDEARDRLDEMRAQPPRAPRRPPGLWAAP
jgi:RHS repeat-associated protein